MLILFLGRNTEGILADARREFSAETDLLVLTREGDALQPPAGATSLSSSRFEPKEGEIYVVIANGGTTSQLLPVLKRLVETKADFTAWDLQRDGKTQVW